MRGTVQVGRIRLRPLPGLLRLRTAQTSFYKVAAHKGFRQNHAADAGLQMLVLHAEDIGEDRLHEFDAVPKRSGSSFRRCSSDCVNLFSELWDSLLCSWILGLQLD